MNEQAIGPYWNEVYRIAKLLAKSYYGYAHDTSPPEVQEQDVDGHIPQARVMVSEMEKSFREGYDYSETEPIWQPSKIEEYLIKRGLIPNLENEQI